MNNTSKNKGNSNQNKKLRERKTHSPVELVNRDKDTRTEKRKTGDIGEEVASVFLMKQGYTIKDRNYLRKYGEIDIVAEKQNKIHFIEVKTVSHETKKNVNHETDGEFRPEDNLHPWKLKRLARVIQAYMLDKKLLQVDWQFDVVTIRLNYQTRRAAVELIENIVL